MEIGCPFRYVTRTVGSPSWNLQDSGREMLHPASGKKYSTSPRIILIGSDASHHVHDLGTLTSNRHGRYKDLEQKYGMAKMRQHISWHTNPIRLLRADLRVITTQRVRCNITASPGSAAHAISLSKPQLEKLSVVRGVRRVEDKQMSVAHSGVKPRWERC